ncbi:MAG TPA: hypothetical protein P5123_07195 [Spirochaetota bacterium]|nr:hypothetical protein [Spirochaetota bacterium]
MKKIKKVMLKSIFFPVLLFTALLYAQDFGVSDYILNPMTIDRLQFMPVTRDFRNYFILQSIDDTTIIIIGDFVGAEKKIVMIIDNESNNEIDAVHEWYPDTKKLISPRKPTTNLFSDLETIKRDIISGKVFEENYAYKMRSLKSLEEKLEQGSDRFKYRHGFTVKLYDPDKPNTIMSDYFFGRKDGRYDLIFKTDYYRLYHSIIRPRVVYSVYCNNSKDPVVKETVENLVKYVE